jgi:glycerophosphoryl diester phosphodiesterase
LGKAKNVVKFLLCLDFLTRPGAVSGINPLNLLSVYPFLDGPKPRILGHRGAAGVAPENTLISFQRAFEDGALFVEFDVRGSKDGEVVIIHDATLQRTTNGRGRVSQLTVKELKAFDAGYWFTPDEGISYPYRGQKIQIPTLEELFSAFPAVKAIVEIKQARPPIVKNVIETVLRCGREDRILLATEKDEIMREVRKALQENGLTIATGFSYGEVAAFVRWVAGGKQGNYAPPGQALQIPCEYRGVTLVSGETVRAAQGLGVEMFVWTVNDVEEMDRLLGLGVDGIITDYPARLRRLVSKQMA